jgi:hypothetical protein
MSSTVCIREFPSRLDADIALATLTSAGIRAFVQVDDMGGMRPDVGFTTGGARLMVSRDDAERAALLIAE